MTTTPIDPAALAHRIASLNVLIRSHAGDIELVEAATDGTVTIRYGGMCAGCDYRPLTTAGTVEPALLDLPGVSSVRVLGTRVSEQAQARIADTLQGSGAAGRAIQLVRKLDQERQQGAAL